MSALRFVLLTTLATVVMLIGIIAVALVIVVVFSP